MIIKNIEYTEFTGEDINIKLYNWVLIIAGGETINNFITFVKPEGNTKLTESEMQKVDDTCKLFKKHNMEYSKDDSLFI